MSKSDKVMHKVCYLCAWKRIPINYQLVSVIKPNTVFFEKVKQYPSTVPIGDRK